MQPLTAPPRDTLSADQVLTVLRDAPHVQVGRGLEVLSLQHLQLVADISDYFLGGTATRNADATVHGTCDLQVAADAPISFPDQLLRPYMTLTAEGVSARFNCGVYVPSRPQQTYGENPATVPISGADLLSLLNRPIGEGYTTVNGSTYLQEVQNALIASGVADVAAAVVIDGLGSSPVMPAPMTWPLFTDPDATNQVPVDAVADGQNATTWLRVVNALLAASNYRGVWMDWDGNLRADAYIDPAARPVEFTFDVDDPLKAIIARPRTRTRDISNTPNAWKFIQSNLVDGSGNPVEPAEGAGQYTVQNLDDGDTSINARGGAPIGVRWSVLELDAPDQTTLEALGDKQVAADRAESVAFSLATSPFPAAWHEDVYSYNDTEMGAGGLKLLSKGWVLDFGSSTQPPADMQHSLVQVG